MTGGCPCAASRSVRRQRVVRVLEPLRTHPRLCAREPGASVRRQRSVAIAQRTSSVTRLTQTVSVPNPAAWRAAMAHANTSHAANSGARTTASTRTTASATAQD